jgi:2'-5' RNA ligase
VIPSGTVEGDERLRLFLALELPRPVATELGTWADEHVVGPGRRRVDTFHVTLAFLGSRPTSELDGIVGALRKCASASEPFTLEPVRYRETRSVGMLVLADPTREATRLAECVQARLETLGVFERERRQWLPHVTVVRLSHARSRERTRGGEPPRQGASRSRARPRAKPPLPATGPFAPSGAAAFLSRLRRTGAQYEVLQTCPLGAASPGS